MNIKEAGHYSNFLNDVLRKSYSELFYEKNLYKITEKHLKNKANPDAVDEEIDATPERKFNIKASDMAYFVTQVIDEKLALALAIDNAKRQIKLDWVEIGENLTLDAAIEYNKKLREFATSYLSSMINNKSTNSKITGADHKFNVEGNQVTYKYVIESIKEIDYDRDAVAKLYKKILTKTDDISTQIDKAMLIDSVEFTPRYDVHDTFEEIVNNYKK